MTYSRQHLLNTFGALFVAVALFTGFHVAQARTAGGGDGCAATTNLSAEQEVQLNGIGGASSRADFSCQNVGSLSPSQRSSNCIDNACSGGTDIKCCKPGTGSPRLTPTSGGGTTSGGIGRLVLPSCVDSGNCQLEDIIQTGVNFANFLFGLSGAIFLAIFVYAGVLYLTAGGNAGRASEAKKKLVDATIGMVLVISAGVLVAFIYNAFLSSSSGEGGTADRCVAAHPTWSCQTLPVANLSTEISNRGCQTGLCSGASNIVCCPPSTP